MRFERLTEGSATPAHPAAGQATGLAAGLVVGPGQVRRRKVFYIPGYDPFPARRYRELYRTEGAAQAALSGYRLAQRQGETPCGWQVTGQFGAVAVETSVEVLPWSDLVRHSMTQGLPGTWMQLLRTVWAYLGSGALVRLLRLRKGPMLAALYPVAMIVAQLAVAAVAGCLAGSGLAESALAAQMPRGTGGAAGVLGGAGVAVVLLIWFRRQDRRLFAHYLMHDFAFVARDGGAYPAVMEDRIALFRAAVAAALRENWDEVLVVGHSSGAQIAVSVLADLVRAAVPPKRPVLGLLTLGQVIPMQSFLPGACRLRADLRDLSLRHDVPWVDVSAPGDGCCFALCDPVAVTGVAPPGAGSPLVISAAFRQTLRPETWARLRWRFHRLHFQYLCAFDSLPGAAADYDYFRITAGPMTLAARFAGRAPSRARITTPVSRHTSTAA